MITLSHISVVKGLHLFRSLDKPQFDDVIKHARLERLEKDQVLFSQGDLVKRFYMVHSGLIKLFRISPDGQEKVIEVISPGQTFAEALMFLEQPAYPVTAMAIKPSEILSFDSRHFLGMLNKSPATCMSLMGAMSQRIRGLVQEIDHLTMQSGRHRLTAYLLMQAGNANAFKLEMPKSVLASRLSIQPETFSRIIKQLRSASAIKVEGSLITIMDREQLEAYAIG